MSDNLEFKYLIIGAGIAGIAAAEAIRENDKNGSLMVVNGEHYTPYCRPLIIELLTGERQFPDIVLRDERWYIDRDVNLITGDPVVELDTPGRIAKLESGTWITFEKLLLAPGSVPSTPPIPGLDKVNYHPLYRAEDVDELKPLTEFCKKTLVIGMGLIGLQAVTALSKLGLDVTAVEMADKVLPLILDNRAAEIAKERLEFHGVDVITGSSVTEFIETTEDDFPYAAKTTSDDVIGFDFLVLATGMRPNLELARKAGIETKRGIKVAPNMETNIPGVYAAGDVVEYPNIIEGSDEIHAHWVNAYRQGRIAGMSMAGVIAETYTPVFLNSLSIFGLPIITLGSSRLDDVGDADIYVTESPSRPAYTRLVVKDGRLIGATLINDVDRAGMLQFLLKERVDLGEVAGSLFKEGKTGMEFLYGLHRDIIRGEVNWPETMDLIDHYRKDMEHTRWGGDKK